MYIAYQDTELKTLAQVGQLLKICHDFTWWFHSGDPEYFSPKPQIVKLPSELISGAQPSITLVNSSKRDFSVKQVLRIIKIECVDKNPGSMYLIIR